MKLATLSFSQAGYERHIFLVGDIHRYQTEATLHGQATLKATDHFLQAMGRYNNHGQKIPILWEASPRTLERSNSPLYLRTKARELYSQQNQQTLPFIFVASDSLREHNPHLKHFMLNLTYRPHLALRELKTRASRQKIAQAIGSGLVAQSELVLAEKFRLIQQSGLPKGLQEALLKNIVWYQEEVGHIKRSLELDLPSLTPQRYFVNYYKQVLIRSTADVELLVNLFARPEKIIVVYAGNGHVRRLEAFLQRLGFRKQFQVERHDYLSRGDFRDFWQVYKSTTSLAGLRTFV